MKGDLRKLAIVEAEPNIRLFLNTHVIAATTRSRDPRHHLPLAGRAGLGALGVP